MVDRLLEQICVVLVTREWMSLVLSPQECATLLPLVQQQGIWQVMDGKHC